MVRCLQLLHDITMEAPANFVLEHLIFDAQDMARLQVASGRPGAGGLFEREHEQGHGPYEESVLLCHCRHLYSIDSAAGHCSIRTLAIGAEYVKCVAPCPGDRLRDVI